jgi:CDP-diglyceride synthetase
VTLRGGQRLRDPRRPQEQVVEAALAGGKPLGLTIAWGLAPSPSLYCCSFCLKADFEVKTLCAGHGSIFADECVEDRRAYMTGRTPKRATAFGVGQVMPYKTSWVSGSRYGAAAMQGFLLLQLLILLVVANGTAIVAKKLLGDAFARPLDCGALFVDGQPIFGPTKTIRGIVVSILATSICAALIGLGWEVGTLVATFAMVGDLLSSFVKRRLHLASSSMAVGIDHVPESLFPLLASRLLLPLSILDIVAGVSIFVLGALILSPLLFKLNVRDEPH